MTDPQVGVLMLALFVFVIMLGFPIAFSLMAMGVGFGYYAYFTPGQDFFQNRIFTLLVQKAFEVSSSDAEGTTFTVSLPRFADDAVQEQQVRRQGVHLVGVERLRLRPWHRAADVIEQRRRKGPVAADGAHRRRVAQRAVAADELIARLTHALLAVACDALGGVHAGAGARGARARRQSGAARSDADVPRRDVRG